MSARLGPKMILEPGEAARFIAQGWTRVRVPGYYRRDEPREWLAESDEAEGEFYIDIDPDSGTSGVGVVFLFSSALTAMAFKMRFG